MRAALKRALWVGNMLALRELTPATVQQAAVLFDIKPAVRYDFGTQGMNFALNGDKYLRVANEPEGISATYCNLRKTSIYGGSNEIQKNIISQWLLKL